MSESEHGHELATSTRHRAVPDAVPELVGPAPFVGGGEMGALVRAHDWARTPLGPVEGWPQRLTATVDLLLGCQFPMVVLWGPGLVQVYNDGYREIMGVKHPAGLGQPTRECWPEVWHINAPIYERVRRGETLPFEDALYPITRGGRLEDAYFTLCHSPLHDEAGVVEGILVTVFETTGRIEAERRRDRVEASLREREGQFRALASVGTDVVYRMSADWTEMRRLDGRGFLADTDAPSDSWLDRYVHVEDRARVMAAIREAIRTGGPFDLEHRVRRVDGTPGWTHSRAVPILDADGGIVEWLGAASDVTARREFEAERARAAVAEAAVAARRALLGRLVEAQEEERRRVASDIHDGVSQLAAAAALHLDELASLLPALPEDATRELERARDLARRTVVESRRLMAGLRPTALDDFGLSRAIGLEVESLRADGWDATYHEALGSERLPSAAEITLFRVAQEALTNVRRHAGHARVRVELKRPDGVVCLSVRDWGVGFDPAGLGAAGADEHVGLTGMRERVRLLGGTFSVLGRLGAGTTIEATVPVAHEGRADERRADEH